MNEISKARIKFFGLFLVVACVISVLVYLFAIVPGRPEKPVEPQIWRTLSEAKPETPVKTISDDKKTETKTSDKAEVKKTQFPRDLDAAFELGRRLAGNCGGNS